MVVAREVEELTHEELTRYVVDLIHRIIMHHGFWFHQVQNQLGPERTYEILDEVYKRSLQVQLKRLGEIFGFDLEKEIPKPLLEMPKEKLLELTDSLAKNWLAHDGIWFQGVEFRYGMNDAKRCNDSCWAHFSPFEAWSIKRLLNLPPNPGIEGVKAALKLRIYSRLNVQAIVDEGPKSIVYQMKRCRVQEARKRKGLEDYPCKSGGLVEYTYFAWSIDPRVKTECVGCPPDPHPDEWYCAWRFYM